MSDHSGRAHRSNVRMGLLVAFLGGLLFSFDLPLLRLAAEAGGNGLALVFLRGLFLFLSVMVIWGFLRISGKIQIPFWGGVAGFGVTACNTVAPIAYIGAVQSTGAANVVLMIALIPLLTALLSHFFLREAVRGWTWLAALATLAGVAIIVSDSLSLGLWRAAGDGLALLSGLCTAISFTIVRATGKNLMTNFALGSLLSSLIALLWGDVGLGHLTATAWVWAALGGLIVIPLATMLVANGPRYLPSVDVSMFFLLETVLTPVWIFLIFSERVPPNVFAGGAIVVLALLVHSGWRLMSTLGNLSLQEARYGS